MRDVNVLTVELLPNFLRAIDAIAIGRVHARNLGFENLVALTPKTHWPQLGGVVGAGGEMQRSADQLDFRWMLAGLDVANYLLV